MRSAIGFLSLVAFGVLAAGVLTVVGQGTGGAVAIDGLLGSEAGGVHLGSLLVGLVLGIVLSAMARVSWSDLPRRFASWLVDHERGFYRLTLAGVLIAVLVFY